MDQRITTQDMDAIVLAGGQSRRMGCTKANMLLNGSTLVERVVSILRPIFKRVLLVGPDPSGMDQLGADVFPDAWSQRGPLVGLATGLAASNESWCFLVGCDMPFLQEAVIFWMAEQLEGCDILVPEIDGALQPLHAFYRRECLPKCEGLLEEGTTSLRSLIQLCPVRVCPLEGLLELDPDLISFKDLDTPEDYQQALKLLK